MKAIVVDLDGTIANCDHRRHYVEGKKKDWDSFFKEMFHDTVNESVRSIINRFQDYRIYILTGRPEQYRTETEDWLKINGIKYHALIMRPDHKDRRTYPDEKLKRELFEEIEGDIEFVIDDRPKVCRMWRKLLGNDKLLQIGDPYNEF